MKIVVTESGSSGVNLRLPTGLVMNRVSALFLRGFLKKHGLHFTRKQTTAFIKALNHYRRSHPEWVLVEVHGAKGEHICIQL